MPVDDITATLKPVSSKDINSGHELTDLFKWFRENLSTQPGKLGELYQRWNGHPASKMGPRGWAARPWNPEDDRMVEELGGIDFGPMLGDGERFANLRGATEEMRVGAESIRNRLSEAWSGPAAEAAAERLDMLGKGAAGFRDTLNQFAAALDAARSTVRETIVNIQTAVRDQIKPFDVPEGVDFRRQQIDRLNAAMTGQEPYGHPWAPDELRRPATVDLNQGEWGHWWSNESINVLDALCDSYFNAISSLRRLIGETTAAINASWNTLNEALKRIQAGADLDPFAKAAPKHQVAVNVSSPDRVGLTVDGKQYAVNFQQEPPMNPAAGGAPAAPAVTEGGGGAAVGGGGVGAAEANQLQPGQMTGAQAPSTVDAPDKPVAGPAGMAGGPAAGGPMGGGGMPMGGMGAGGGGGGGDSDRKDSKWRTQGDLFDDAAQEAIPMVIGDDDPYGEYGREET